MPGVYIWWLAHLVIKYSELMHFHTDGGQFSLIIKIVRAYETNVVKKNKLLGRSCHSCLLLLFRR